MANTPGSTRLSYITFKTKHANLYSITLVTILCTIFYVAGMWQHSPGAIPGATSPSSSSSHILTSVPCSSASAKASANLNLDFSAHHQATDPPPTLARVTHIPPCDPKYVEYVPCEDTHRSLKFDRDRLIYRERHCPEKTELLKCRVPAPHGYTVPFRWPESRRFAWYANVPHKELTVEKKNQNWVRFEDDRFSFPGGGTMFPRGADAYIDDIGKLINLKDGSIRTAIDTGCGVRTTNL